MTPRTSHESATAPPTKSRSGPSEAATASGTASGCGRSPAAPASARIRVIVSDTRVPGAIVACGAAYPGTGEP